MFQHAAKLGWEGISARTEGRLKIKTVQKWKFPVIGFMEGATGVAALYGLPIWERQLLAQSRPSADFARR
jgi:hypothetical protein